MPEGFVDALRAAEQELAQTIRELVQEVEKGHVYFFRLHHPERERLEREGWPSPEKPE